MTRRLKSELSLAAVAVLATVAWRAEVLARPQGGFDFISYTHWTIPFAMALFIGWAAIFAPLKTALRRIGFAVVAGLSAPGWYAFFFGAINTYYNSWSLGASVWGPWHYRILLIIPLTPVIFWALLRCFGARPADWRIGAAVGTYVLAGPVSTAIVERIPSLTNGEGVIDAVKSGIIVPFLIYGLGILALAPDRAGEDASASDMGSEACGHS